MERRESVNALKETARLAGYGISQDPDRYGNSLLDSLESELQQFERQIPDEFKEEYTKKYINLYTHWMHAMGRCISPFIAGPSGFNSKRAKKYNDYEHSAREKLNEWSEKVIRRLNRPVKLTGWDEIERLQNKIDTLTEMQEKMKAANAIIRKKIADVEKVDDLQDLGFTEKQAVQLLEVPKYGYSNGFPSWKLSNNNAVIRSTTERMNRLIKIANSEDKSYDIEGGTIELCNSEERVRIIFDERPDREMIDKLKHGGFHWSPSNGAWQRQITADAKWKIDQLFHVKID